MKKIISGIAKACQIFLNLDNVYKKVLAFFANNSVNTKRISIILIYLCILDRGKHIILGFIY